ncbi:MAG: hypothetical protein COC01_03785 [Bacteroidetes bacterium]|nr:MAG: hypothetical protein COC01_03785 [Bacteroidota bacterium]
MRIVHIYSFILLAGLLLLTYTQVLTYSISPPAATTGAPGELTCSQVTCHNDNTATIGGTIDFNGGNNKYIPGEIYTITLTGESGVKNGFEFVSLTNENDKNTGSIIVSDLTNTQTDNNGSKKYLTHTFSGINQNSWSFDWEAPATNAGDINFYAVFNKADGDGTVSGDSIFTKTLTITPDTIYIDTSSLIPQTKTVLLENFVGGVRVVNVPSGDSIMESLIDQNPGKVISLRITSESPFSVPYTDSKHDFRMNDGTSLETLLGPPQGYPLGAINRKLLNGESEILLTKDKWSTYVQQELQDTTPVNITMGYYWDNTTSELTVNVKLHYLEEITGYHYISVALIENNVIDLQKSSAGIDTYYVHKYVLREMMTPYNGSLVKVPKDSIIEKGRVIITDFETTLPDSFKLSNMQVISFVHRADTAFDVMQAALIDTLTIFPIGIHKTVKNYRSLKIYPNPTLDILNIVYSGSLGNNSKVFITDLSGKMVFTSKLSKAKNSIDISHLANGIYYLTLQNNTAIVTKKFMKIR